MSRDLLRRLLVVAAFCAPTLPAEGRIREYVVGINQGAASSDLVSFVCREGEKCGAKLPIRSSEGTTVNVSILGKVVAGSARLAFVTDSYALYVGGQSGGDKPFAFLYLDNNDHSRKIIGLFEPPASTLQQQGLIQAPIHVVAHRKIADLEIVISPNE